MSADLGRLGVPANACAGQPCLAASTVAAAAASCGTFAGVELATGYVNGQSGDEGS